MNMKCGGGRGGDTVDQQLDFLLKSAELNVVEFDIHRRKEMQTFRRTLPYCVVLGSP